MTINFDKYADGGREFVKKIAAEMGDEKDLGRAGRLLKTTLHVLRDQSTPEECLQLVSQLPMMIKAIFVDGWTPGKKKGRVRHYNDFLAAVHREHWATYRKHDLEDFLDDDECEESVKAVLRVIKSYVSEEELAEFSATLPEELRELLAGTRP